MVEQTTLYEFLELHEDPVFNQIENLREGDEVQIDSFTVRKTDKFFEVENEEFHEPFRTVNKCYSFISSKL